MSAIFTYHPAEEFTALYNQLYTIEGRTYTDEEVAMLPVVNKTHPYYKEWQNRKKSFKRLQEYLLRRNDEPDILEIGCGNGWLSAQLAAVTKGTVTGIDINEAALEQAERVFHYLPNLGFKYCTLQDEILLDKNFDVIIFAASIQYFPSLKKIISQALQYLTLQGEIHITDTFLYRQNQIAGARQLSKAYFRSAGVEAMAGFYFHHSIEDLKKFNCTILHNPTTFLNRFSTNKNPFYHVVIKNRHQ